MKTERIIVQQNIEIPKNKKLETKIINKKEIPRFYMIGSGIKNENIDNHHPISMFDILKDITQPEQYVMEVIGKSLEPAYDEMNKKYYTTCKINISDIKMTPSNRVKFSKGYKRLHSRNILKKIKRQHYMLNPDFLIPTYYEQEKKEFDKLD